MHRSGDADVGQAAMATRKKPALLPKTPGSSFIDSISCPGAEGIKLSCFPITKGDFPQFCRSRRSRGKRPRAL